MGLFHVIFSCLVYSALGQVQEIPITKCCPNNQIFDMNSPNHCVNKESSIESVDVTAFVENSDKPGTFLQAQLKTSKDFLIQCHDGFEVHKLKTSNNEDDNINTYLTSNGMLVVSKYGPEETFPQDKFCIDRNENNEIIAVMCDLCKEGYTCIQLCCPHGYSHQKSRL